MADKKDDKKEFNEEPKYYFEDTDEGKADNKKTEDSKSSDVKKENQEEEADNKKTEDSKSSDAKKESKDKKTSDDSKKGDKKHSESKKEETKSSAKEKSTHSKKTKKHKKEEGNTTWYWIAGIAIVAIIIIIVATQLNGGLKIAEEFQFTNDKIILDVQGDVQKSDIKLYSDSSKTTEFEQGEDYTVTLKDQQTETRVTIKRLEDGIIPENERVFLFYNPQTKEPKDSTEEETKGQAVAKVNEEKITDEELLSEYNTFFIVAGYPESFKSMITLKSYLNQSILETLLMQEAQEKGISASDEKIDQIMTQYLAKTNSTEEQFKERLSKQDLEINDVREFFEKNIVISELVNQTLNEVTVTDEELETYYEENQQQFEQPERVNASHILICYQNTTGCQNNLTQSEALARAEEVKDMLDDEDFADVALEYSTGPSASKGGNLGFFARDGMIPKFSEVAFNLSEGEVSDFVETQYGIHIIKVHERKEAETQSFEEVKGQLRETLLQQKRSEAFNVYSSQLRQEADIVVYEDRLNTSETASPVQNVQIDQGN